MPRPMVSVTSVATKGTRPTRAMRKALTQPHAVPATTPAPMATSMGTPCCRSMPMTAPVMYIVAPTERSMPPVSSTMVMPTATRPTKADVLTMLEKLVNVAKRGSRRLKSTKTSTKRMAGMLRRTGMVQSVRGHAACSRKAARRMTSWSNCARSNEPRTSPWPMTMMRSHMPSSSSSSDEMKSTAVPPAAMRSMIS